MRIHSVKFMNSHELLVSCFIFQTFDGQISGNPENGAKSHGKTHGFLVWDFPQTNPWLSGGAQSIPPGRGHVSLPAWRQSAAGGLQCPQRPETISWHETNYPLSLMYRTNMSFMDPISCLISDIILYYTNYIMFMQGKNSGICNNGIVFDIEYHSSMSQ